MIRPCLTSSEVNPFSFLACLEAVGSFAPSATSAAAHHSIAFSVAGSPWTVSIVPPQLHLNWR